MDVNVEFILQFNEIMKECDSVYRKFAKKFGISECGLWIVYTIRLSEPIVQSEICSRIYQSKQTINSSLKKLHEDGYIEMTADIDKRKKLLSLTDKGTELAKRTADAVIAAEGGSLASFSDKERSEFFRLYKKFICNMKKNMEEI